MTKVLAAVLEKRAARSIQAARKKNAARTPAATSAGEEAFDSSLEATRLSLEKLSPKLFDYAEKIWGSSQDAVEWFLHPHRELDSLPPLTVLAAVDGPERVRAVLVALDHGFPV